MEVIFVLKLSTGQFSIVNYGQYPCDSILKSLISVQAKKKKSIFDTHLFHAVLYLSFISNCFISLDYQGILIYVIEARLKKLGGGGGEECEELNLRKIWNAWFSLVSLSHLLFKRRWLPVMENGFVRAPLFTEQIWIPLE